jgi:predicted Zn finger-like uncharacterized protein
VNVSCPECRSVFRVDPSKVPATTVRARCSVCGGVITISEGSSIDDDFASTGRPSSTAVTEPASSSAVAARETESWISSSGNVGIASERGAAGRSVERDAVRASGFVENATNVAVNRTAATRTANEAAPPPTISAPRVSGPAHPEAASRTQPAIPPSSAPSSKPQPNRPVLFPPRPMMPSSATGQGSSPARPLTAPARLTTPSPPAPPAQVPATQRAPARPLSQAPVAPTSSAPNASVASAPHASGTPQAGAGTPTRAPINPFLANDPHAKAKRLARALVSDLVTYFPQKCEEGIRDGTLKQLFKEEIQKSYEEYVLQVGREFAESTPHFQDALNDILARGQKVF